MNWIDIIILAGTAYLIIRGWQTGIIKTIFRYLSIPAGLITAISYQESFRLKLAGLEFNLSDFWLTTLSFVILFIIAAGGVQMLGFFISKLLKPTPLGPLDRISGAFIGVVKAGLICILLTFLLSLAPSRSSFSSHLAGSTVLRECLIVLPWLKKVYADHGLRLLSPVKYFSPDSLQDVKTDSVDSISSESPEAAE
ncbi:CvpA family protein [Fibrobacterota bacterium]